MHSSPVGNYYDKYGTRNPIARLLMRGFTDSVVELFERAAPETVLEVGCGEGHLANILLDGHPTLKQFDACDLSMERLSADTSTDIRFFEASIYDLPIEDNRYDLVICCEVLEHLHHPQMALAEITRVSKEFVLVSTPWEPIWRVLNLARGQYISDMGNTPGHVQHFSRRHLRDSVGQRLRIDAMRTPLPWTILLGRKT